MPSDPFHIENRELRAKLLRFRSELAAWKVLIAGRRYARLLRKYNPG